MAMPTAALPTRFSARSVVFIPIDCPAKARHWRSSCLNLEGLARRWHTATRGRWAAGAAGEQREGMSRWTLLAIFHGCLSPDGCVPSGGSGGDGSQPSGAEYKSSSPELSQ
jgi:hypothetical protein